jgi:hypothetical protein
VHRWGGSGWVECPLRGEPTPVPARPGRRRRREADGRSKWTPERDPAYLATGAEVRGHLQHCVEAVRRQVALEEHYGYSYVSHEETSGEVRVHCMPVELGRPPLRIKARRLIKAAGHNIQQNDRLRLSSAHARSASPDLDDLLGDEMRASDAPVYVVGGGKTGMDTAHALVTRFPGKKIRLLIGSGVMFSRRDLFFPERARRWWGGTTPLDGFLDAARRFNGDNEAEVIAYFRSKYTVALHGDCKRFMFGVLSDRENQVIARGVDEVLRDYLVDVVDRDGKPTMLLRSGGSRPVEPGSWVVNCTGYVFNERRPYEPYVSEGGNVLSIQNTSCVHFLSTNAAYLLTHLLYLGKLRQLPLYELDMLELYRVSKDVFPYAGMAHVLHNAGQILAAVPSSVLDEFGANLDLWYPMPRRLLSFLRFSRFQKRHPDSFRLSLDRVRARFGIRCGPLPHVVGQTDRQPAAAE